jgi:hypothetical protein
MRVAQQQRRVRGTDQDPGLRCFVESSDEIWSCRRVNCRTCTEGLTLGFVNRSGLWVPKCTAGWCRDGGQQESRVPGAGILAPKHIFRSVGCSKRLPILRVRYGLGLPRDERQGRHLLRDAAARERRGNGAVVPIEGRGGRARGV